MQWGSTTCSGKSIDDSLTTVHKSHYLPLSSKISMIFAGRAILISGLLNLPNNMVLDYELNDRVIYAITCSSDDAIELSLSNHTNIAHRICASIVILYRVFQK